MITLGLVYKILWMEIYTDGNLEVPRVNIQHGDGGYLGFQSLLSVLQCQEQ